MGTHITYSLECILECPLHLSPKHRQVTLCPLINWCARPFTLYKSCSTRLLIRAIDWVFYTLNNPCGLHHVLLNESTIFCACVSLLNGRKGSSRLTWCVIFS